MDKLREALQKYVQLDDDRRAGCRITDEDWAICYQSANEALAQSTDVRPSDNEIISSLKQLVGAVNCNYDPQTIKGQDFFAVAEAAVQAQAMPEGCLGCVSILLDMCQDVLNNWESGDLAGAVNEMEFAMNDLKESFKEAERVANGVPSGSAIEHLRAVLEDEDHGCDDMDEAARDLLDSYAPARAIVTVEGGNVQHVACPDGVVVEIHDYDNGEQYDLDDPECEEDRGCYAKDSDGKWYSVDEWGTSPAEPALVIVNKNKDVIGDVNVPSGVKLQIRDYQVEDVSPEEIEENLASGAMERDKDGTLYWLNTWGAE